MKTITSLIILCALLLVPMTTQAFPPKKGDKDCKECHKLDKKEAETVVRKIAPTGTVVDIKESAIRGVWQIDVDAGEGKRGALYMDFSKKHLIAGQIVPIEAIGKQTPTKVDVTKIPLDDAIIVGSPKAKKKVIVFTDPDCPYCRELHKTIKQVISKRDDVAFLMIIFPLPMHKDAYKKTQSILCSRSLEMVDDAFSGKAVPEPPANCSADLVEKNKALAKAMEFGGTPTLVRDDGIVAAGALPEDKLNDWIDKK